MDKDLQELLDWVQVRRKECESRGEPMFLGIPCRWYEEPGPKFRCTKGHVSQTILKSETRGDLCLACLAPVVLTFPEDQDDKHD